MQFLNRLRNFSIPIKNRKFLLFVVDSFALFFVYSIMLLAEVINGIVIFNRDLLNLYLPNFLIFLSFIFSSRLIGGVYSTLWRYASTITF